MSDLVAQESLRALAHGSRSFHLASRFLPRDRRDDATLLYAFCRLVDDLADESDSPEQAHEALGRMQEELHGRWRPRPLVEAFLFMADRRGIDLSNADELVRGVLSDLTEVRVADDRELMRYCYRVAGTVGLMMCPILGVQDADGQAFALDLGVAMQLTNICRDVAEDARMGRVYLPADRLQSKGLSQEDLLQGSMPDDRGVRRVVQDLLLLAEDYYVSADRGLRFIPVKPRAAILVASRVYREIGRKLQRNQCDVFARRTVVSGWQKAIVAGGALLRLLHPTTLGIFEHPHDEVLHRQISDLPGAHVGTRQLRPGQVIQAGARQ